MLAQANLAVSPGPSSMLYAEMLGAIYIGPGDEAKGNLCEPYYTISRAAYMGA